MCVLCPLSGARSCGDEADPGGTAADVGGCWEKSQGATLGVGRELSSWKFDGGRLLLFRLEGVEVGRWLAKKTS